MKTKQFLYLSFTAVVIFISACTTPGSNTTAIQSEVSVDSLESAWDSAWNAHDLETLENMISDNSIVFTDGWKAMGKDSVIEKFLKINLPINRGFKSSKIMDGSSPGMVYRVGEWSMDFIKSDSTIGTNKGVFTIIWKKQTDNKWRVEVLQTGSKE